MQDDGLPSCENKFRWLGATAKYVASCLDAWSAKRNCLHVSFLLLSPSYAKVENTGRWNSISGAAAPMNFLLIDSEQNVFPAAEDDTGCAVCLCTGNTSEKLRTSILSSGNFFPGLLMSRKRYHTFNSCLERKHLRL